LESKYLVALDLIASMNVCESKEDVLQSEPCKLEEGLFSAKLKDDDLADGSGLPEGAPKDVSPLL